MPAETGSTYVLPILCYVQQSSDNSFSQAVVTFEVDHHQERMCPHGMKVVMYNDFTPYYWAGSQWQLSKHRVRRRTWCNSVRTHGYISTDWTELIKHVVQGVAGYCSSKLALPSVSSTLFFAEGAQERKQQGYRRDLYSTSGAKMFCWLNFVNPEEKLGQKRKILNNIPKWLVWFWIHFMTPRYSSKISWWLFVPPTNKLTSF